MTSESCADVLHRFQRRDFRTWVGMPGDCALGDVERTFGLSDPYAVGRLGRRHVQASFRVATLEGFLEPVQVWYRDDNVVLLTGQYPDLPVELPELLAECGEPEARLDYHQGVIEIAGGEWVYPQRGITLFMNADFSRLAKVAVYPPTSLEDYEAQLSPRERIREFDEQ